MSCVNTNEIQQIDSNLEGYTKSALLQRLDSAEDCLSRIEKENKQIIKDLTFQYRIQIEGLTISSDIKQPFTVGFENDMRKTILELCNEFIMKKCTNKKIITINQIEAVTASLILDAMEWIHGKYVYWINRSIGKYEENVSYDVDGNVVTNIDKYGIYLRKMLYNNKQHEQNIIEILESSGRKFDKSYENTKTRLISEIEDIYNMLLLM